MGSLRVLVWIHAVTGIVLAFGGVTAALQMQSELLGAGTLVAGILWLLGYGPLRRRAERFTEEARQQPETTLPWLPKALGIAQLSGAVLTVITAMGSAIILANVALILAIMVYVLCCHGMDVRVDSKYWGLVLGILALGIAGNFAGLVFFLLRH